MTPRLALAAIAGTALLVALLPAAAPAASADRNRDRIPDRWEQAHRLSLKVKQTTKDQDRDGLRNLAEWRNHTDPRDADSDNDGLDDGDEVEVGSNPMDRDSDDDGMRDDDENAGTIRSFVGGKLMIALAGGDTLTAGVVDGFTEITCADVRGDGGGQADDAHADHDDHGDDDHGDDDHGDDDHGDDDHGDAAAECTVADLTVGAIVHEATVKTMGGRAVFTEIQVIPAA